ncbi:MAG: hypothetical protein Q4D35_03150 [Ruminococcus sp.]|nr:hypothetical protein [Ruminococcus sp.]
MNLADKVERYAQIKMEMDALKSERDNIEADILKAAEADLKDTKFKTISYSDNHGNVITATNSDNVKIIYPTMLKVIFGKAYADAVKEDVTYKLSASAKRLLAAVYNGEYIKDGSIEDILKALNLDDESFNTLKKKLKGANYNTDVKNLMKFADLDEIEAKENAYLVAEAVAWQNLKHLLTLNNRCIDDDVVEGITETIDSAVIVEQIPKITFIAAK